MALNQELSEKNYSRIVYQGSNRAVHSCLWRLCKHKNIDYIWQQTRKRKLLFNLRTIWRVIPPYLRAPIYLFKYLFKRWKIRQVHTPKWATKKKSLFFLSYFIHLDQKAGESGAFYSKQWEKLPEHLQTMGFQLNWVHLFLTIPVVPNAQTATVWLNRFQQDSEKQGFHTLLDQYLDPQMIGQVTGELYFSIPTF